MSTCLGVTGAPGVRSAHVGVWRAPSMAGAARGLGAAAAVLLAGAVVRRNEAALAEVRPSTEAGGPRVDVVVPARNEATLIAACVRGVAAQGVVARITVVDDGSTDGTGDAAAAAGAGVLRLDGAPPPGWTGKTQAASRGAALGDSPWIAFVDADVRLLPGALRALLAHAESTGLDAVSPLLAQRCAGIADSLVVPLAYWQYAAGMHGVAAVGLERPRRALLNGQCLVVRRAAYQACGGHAHPDVRGTPVEDAALARLLARRGARVGMVRGSALGEVSMYASARALRLGFLKNAGELVAADPLRGAAVAATGVVLAQVPGVVAGAVRGPSRGRVAGAVAAYLSAAAVLLPRYRAARVPAVAVLAHPVAAMAMQVIAVESLLRLALRRPAPWKGRSLRRSRA